MYPLNITLMKYLEHLFVTNFARLGGVFWSLKDFDKKEKKCSVIGIKCSIIGIEFVFLFFLSVYSQVDDQSGPNQCFSYAMYPLVPTKDKTDLQIYGLLCKCISTALTFLVLCSLIRLCSTPSQDLF